MVFIGSWLVSLLFKLGAINYGYALNNNKKNEEIFDLRKKCKKVFIYADIHFNISLKIPFYHLKLMIFCIPLLSRAIGDLYNDTRNTFKPLL